MGRASLRDPPKRGPPGRESRLNGRASRPNERAPSRLKGRAPSRSGRRAGGRPSPSWGRPRGRPARKGGRPSDELLLNGRRPSLRRASGRRPSEPNRDSPRPSGRPSPRPPSERPSKRPSKRRSGRPPAGRKRSPRGPSPRPPSKRGARAPSGRSPPKRRWGRSERPSRSAPPSGRHSPRALNGFGPRKGGRPPAAPEPCPWSLRRSKRGLMADRQMGYGSAFSS